MSKTQTMTVAPPQEVQLPGPSTTGTFELSLRAPAKSLRELSRRVVSSTTSPPSPARSSSDEENNIRDEVDPPADAQPVTQRWNEPKANIWRLGFAFFSFIVTGMNDGAVGVCKHQAFAHGSSCVLT